MGITSDTPRNYEQYGVPGMTMGSSHSHGQQYRGHGVGVPSGGMDPMSAALGALMQPAPSMANAPRPGTVAVGGAPPPPAPPVGVGVATGNPPRPPGSFSPPDGTYNLNGFPATPSISAHATPRVTSSLPIPSAAPPLSPIPPRSPMAHFPGPAAAGPRPLVGLGRGGSVSLLMNEGAASPRTFPPVAVQVNQHPTTGKSTAAGATDGSVDINSGIPSVDTPPSPAGPSPVEGVDVPAISVGAGAADSSPAEVVVERDADQSASPKVVHITADVGGLGGGGFGVGAGVPPGSGGLAGAHGAVKTGIELPSRFQMQTTLASPSGGVLNVNAAHSPPPPGPPPVQAPTQRPVRAPIGHASNRVRVLMLWCLHFLQISFMRVGSDMCRLFPSISCHVPVHRKARMTFVALGGASVGPVVRRGSLSQ